jgi:predicted solute-binding protein
MLPKWRALLIGDKGYRDYGTDLHVLDWGAACGREWTGLPFVYALG